MNRRLAGATLAAALAVGTVTAGAAVAPALASSTDEAMATDGTTAPEDGATAESPTDDEDLAERLAARVEAIRGALDELVSEGTIDDGQADAVTDALSEAGPGGGPGGPGGHGGADGMTGPRGMTGPGGMGAVGRAGLATAAETLGVEESALVEALQGGESLADVAAEEGVDTDTLVDALVTAAQEHLAEHVEAGEITQEQADERSADLVEQVTEAVEREGFAGPPGRGGPAGVPAPDAADEGTAPSEDDTTTTPTTTAWTA